MFNEMPGYRCVSCDQDTIVIKDNSFDCTDCNLSYPVIDGIPVFTRRASQFVVAQAEELSSVRGKLKQLQETFSQQSVTEKAPIISARALKMATGLSLNIALLDKQCEAIWTYANNASAGNDTIALATTQSGYSFDELLPYFYQDWFGTKPFADVVQNILPAVNDFCDERDSVAVFGAGACGLVYVLSEHYQKSIGVDLALPGLIMAKRLIEGERLSLCLEKADWMNIELSLPSSKHHNMHFIAANVMDTPFPDKSLSTVVTQYLLDIVPNAAWFMHEIRRILKPGGVWINFSKPFSWPSDNAALGPRRLSEITSILHDMGFNELQSKMTRFNVLSMEDIFQGGERFDQEVHMFAARKGDNASRGPCSSVKGRIQKDQDEVWNQIPRLVESREIAVIDKTVYAAGLQTHTTGIHVLDTFMPLEQDFLTVISILLEAIDGRRTVRQLQFVLQERGIVMADTDFLDLIYCLNVQYYLLEFVGEFAAV